MRKLITLSILSIMSFMKTTAQDASNLVPSVQVSGEAFVAIVPDYATISLGAETKHSNAETSKKENDEIIKKALQILKKAEIADKNIQTQRINLNKQRDYETKEDFFVTNQTLVIELHQLDKYDKIMTDLMAAGINVIHGIEFKSTQTAIYETEVRQKAVKDALKKANDYASALNQQVGKAIHISDQPTQIIRPMLYAMKASDAAMETTVAEGEIKITSTVNISFELK